MNDFEKGHLEVIKKLLANGTNINQENKDGYTPLILAAQYDYIEIFVF